MKGKIVRGKDFGGLLRYLLRPDKGGVIIGGNMAGTDVKSLTREFKNIAGLRKDCEKPVWHASLRMPEGEDVPTADWLNIIAHYMRLMSIATNRPWLLVHHPGDHVHFVTSRVDNDAKIWEGAFEVFKSIRATSEIEKLCKLTITRSLRELQPKQVRLTSGQLKKVDREWKRNKRPEVPGKVEIAERIEESLKTCNGTFNDFTKKLAELGVSTQFNKATTGHVSGISYGWNGINIKGSRVARAYSYGGIKQLLKDKNENSTTAGKADITEPNGNGSGAAQQSFAGADKQPELTGDRQYEVKPIGWEPEGVANRGNGAGSVSNQPASGEGGNDGLPTGTPKRIAPANRAALEIKLG